MNRNAPRDDLTRYFALLDKGIFDGYPQDMPRLGTADTAELEALMERLGISVQWVRSDMAGIERKRNTIARERN